MSDFQRGVLALRKREVWAEGRAHAIAATADTDAPPFSPDLQMAATEANPLKSRADIAKAARLSSTQVVQIERIQKQAVPELVAAIKAGTISLNAAAAVASLTTEEQRSAALAGKNELKQAAKRVREVSRRRDPEEAAAPTPSGDEVQTLQERVAALSAENQALKAQVAELQARLMG